MTLCLGDALLINTVHRKRRSSLLFSVRALHGGAENPLWIHARLLSECRRRETPNVPSLMCEKKFNREASEKLRGDYPTDAAAAAAAAVTATALYL